MAGRYCLRTIPLIAAEGVASVIILLSFRSELNVTTARSVLLFLIAGLCEIGGGYLVWLWLRNGRSVALGVLGGLLFFLYGVLPTLQPITFDFGRVYAAYGGVFVVLSMIWGWRIDGHKPDIQTVVAAAICLVGVSVIMYWRRQGNLV